MLNDREISKLSAPHKGISSLIEANCRKNSKKQDPVVGMVDYTLPNVYCTSIPGKN